MTKQREYLKTCSLRETARWLHRKTGRYISHVGLRKRLEEIAPPKPKKIVQQKAKKSVKQILARTRKKVAKAEQSLRSAKMSAENTKKKLLTIDKALTGKDTQLLPRT